MAPAAIVVDGLPPKVSGRAEDGTIDASFWRSATFAAPTGSGSRAEHVAEHDAHAVAAEARVDDLAERLPVEVERRRAGGRRRRRDLRAARTTAVAHVPTQ